MSKKGRIAFVVVVAGLVAVGVLLTLVDESPERAGALAAPMNVPRSVAASPAEAQVVPASAASAVAPPSVSEAAAARVSGPRIAPVIDWGRYPGTLHTQIQRALQTHDGVMAADLARKLWECDITARLMRPESIQRQLDLGGSDVALSAIRNAEFQKDQRILANCQTVVGDPVQLRRALLDMGVAQGVVGASYDAYHLGRKSPEVQQGIVRDALAGHLFSLVSATSVNPAELGLSKDQQRVLRHAFELAARDPGVGAMVRPYVDSAEVTAAALAGEPIRPFNHDGLTDAMRAQARLVAAQVVDRIKQPRPDEVIRPEALPAR